ncbi:hypothetical protein BT96DRAFT_1050276 [Gymnopus androsaceus JB14]|uniref:Uncharacterized protein n=1 Tax=Gymnopus androsaceus JB14 TaxID=1447944 RepID=A0A6A4H656_9AGAR|nr:hypothetical protein BT96DRAFT_1050276 [Gymnopus androsaceus JB14]
MPTKYLFYMAMSNVAYYGFRKANLWFSVQGAAMAEQIAAMVVALPPWKDESFPYVFQNGVAPPPPFLSWESLDSKRQSRYNIAALSLVGPETPGGSTWWDEMILFVLLERSHIFVAAFKVQIRVEEHNGGHFIPLQHKWQKFFVSFFLNISFAEISSPTPFLYQRSPMRLSITPRPRIETYQTGPSLHAGLLMIGILLYEERGREPFLFSVFNPNSGSDSESDEHRSIYSSPILHLPPDTPYHEDTSITGIELEEPGISYVHPSMTSMKVADFIPGARGHQGVLAGQVQVMTKGLIFSIHEAYYYYFFRQPF